jgi:FtsP/CotA-like multicopper oxidase with cupredoxin domain
MELESVFDGVSGWSRTGSNVAPLLAPGDSFTVAFTPPRAGTFIYHTHMDEGAQLRTGLYGPLIVLAPGERWNPATDLVFMFGDAVDRDSVGVAINGRREPAPLDLRVGTTYRLRLINIHPAGAALVDLAEDSTAVAWRALAKDGADLPAASRVEAPARLRRFGVGETYDFAWTPGRPMDAVLSVRIEGVLRQQLLRVR